MMIRSNGTHIGVSVHLTNFTPTWRDLLLASPCPSSSLNTRDQRFFNSNVFVPERHSAERVIFQPFCDIDSERNEFNPSF